MAFGSADDLRLDLKQPADGDPTHPRQLGRVQLFHRLQLTWKRSLGASRRARIIAAGIGTGSTTTSASATASALDVDGLDAFLRAEWRAQRAPTCVKLIGGFDGCGFNADVVYDGPPSRSRPRATRGYRRPARRPAEVARSHGTFTDHPPRRATSRR